MDGLDGYGWDLCVGLLYEHLFAMLISINNITNTVIIICLGRKKYFFPKIAFSFLVSLYYGHFLSWEISFPPDQYSVAL